MEFLGSSHRDTELDEASKKDRNWPCYRVNDSRSAQTSSATEVGRRFAAAAAVRLPTFGL